MTENNRYARQIVLPEIGEGGQNKISNASVLCIGAGGLGCPALLYLAAAGVGHIGIVDFDKVDESNLQRQTLYSTDQIGQNKAKAAKTRLEALNPEIKITALPIKLEANNAEDLFKQYDLIIDGSDNFDTKYLINDAALKTEKPWVYASILGFEGQLSVFNYQGGPCYRCLFPAKPTGQIPNCAEAGIIGALAGTIGAMQAMEAIKIIVDHKDLEPLSGKLWMIDARTHQTRILKLPKDPDCLISSRPASQINLETLNIKEIDTATAQTMENVLFLDVREQHEWDEGHIKGAELFPLSRIAKGELPSLPQDRTIVLYCQIGARSLYAAHLIHEATDHPNLINLIGGFQAWKTP